ncbi:Uncharacterized protein Adt_05772 [Abeliophyllum distichum]|uniref:Uncharacterized protein n=1 Tax=Abeliophyllum distichum TaxID=126358 RepID=A0ABD1V514_9LAMI
MKLHEGSKRRARGKLASPWAPTESTADLVYRERRGRSAFDQMGVDHELTVIFEPLFSFTGYSLIPRGRITLAKDFDEPPRHLRKFMKLLIVDTRFTYYGVLGRLALKNLQAATSIHHLAIKFPTP